MRLPGLRFYVGFSLVCAMGHIPLALSAPAYLDGLFEMKPIRPYTTTYSSSPEKEECEAMQMEWDKYWDELRSRHQPCLDRNEGMPSSGESRGCSYEECEPYHDVGSKDVDVRTAIRACFAAAKEVEEKKEAEEIAAKESEKEKQLEAEKNAKAILDAQKKQEEEEKEEQDVAQAELDRQKKEEEEKKRLEKNRKDSEERRDRASEDYHKALKELDKAYDRNSKEYAERKQVLDANRAAADQAKRDAFDVAQRLVGAIGMPDRVNKDILLAIAGSSVRSKSKTLTEFAGAAGSFKTKETIWAPFQIPFRMVSDITEAQLEVVDMLGESITKAASGESDSNGDAELDAVLGKMREPFTPEKLLINTIGKTLPAVAVPMEKELKFLPGIWGAYVEEAGRRKIDLGEILSRSADDFYESIEDSWLLPR